MRLSSDIYIYIYNIFLATILYIWGHIYLFEYKRTYLYIYIISKNLFLYIAVQISLMAYFSIMKTDYAFNYTDYTHCANVKKKW